MKGNVAAIVLIVFGIFFLLTNLGLINISLAELLKTWWPAILAFLHTGLTTARTEGFNRLVKQVKRVACGFRNTENSRRRIRFHCSRAQRASIGFTTAQLPG